MWIRPREISLLKVKDFDLTNFKIRVPANISKNSKLCFITIPVAFRRFVIDTNLGVQQPENFIFTNDNDNKLFGAVGVADNLFTKYHSALRDKLQLSKEVKLYGWKRTGVLNAAVNGVSIHAIKSHGRWSSLDLVDTYLKKSGINEFEEKEINKMKGLKN